jgi:hypothetical protein
MRYALLLYQEEPPEVTPEMIEHHVGEFAGFVKEMTDRGVLLGGSPLSPLQAATAVRVRDGKTITTDGPFAETKEALAGFFVVDCADLDEAIEIAAKVPTAGMGTVEVRPVAEEIEALMQARLQG